ncbi:Hypothetical predicted protein [Marmota monax]|uniref:BZIP domain-containing protein n=1 Tax=Marmota monax TaxID=9995 RepID=A0A5E4CL82_MARMO|nr:hypothetical protein GHT09_017427 [Marmota monax]VTJ81682.1 Hypothetical predicted protein [Marmota monax]
MSPSLSTCSVGQRASEPVVTSWSLLQEGSHGPWTALSEDDKYWARRRKNNMAAKRSRDARRLKENQIAIRASFLEKENSALRQEVADLRKELGKCKNILAKYEARHGPL